MLDSSRALLRDHLLLHNENKKTIEDFRESILYPHKESDENIGGGRSNVTSDPTGTTAVKLVSPTELKKTVEIVSKIDKILKKCTSEHYDVINSKYINGYKNKKNEIVANETHLSVSTVKRKDREFLETLRLETGYP